MKTIKKIVLVFVALLSITAMNAQEESGASLDLGLDVQSRYIWRGIQLGGNSASAQPYIELSAGNFSVGAWGAYNLGGLGIGNEADLYMSYAFSDAFSVTVTDYFFPGEGSGGYFPYNAGHVFEAMLSYSGPIGITVATNFGGAIKYMDGLDEKSAYSTYVEASYETEIGGTPLSFAVGGVFGDDNGYYYTDGSGLINLSIGTSKEIKLSDSFSLPVNAAFTVNPDSEDVFLTFGFSL
ncbi:TorF family putative porin [Lutibacter sp.]|uniref:TorF family putative porin n=1 Tax=Lutibacter sp. TaxID=1925666 RepID=UPI003568A390